MRVDGSHTCIKLMQLHGAEARRGVPISRSLLKLDVIEIKCTWLPAWCFIHRTGSSLGASGRGSLPISGNLVNSWMPSRWYMHVLEFYMELRARGCKRQKGCHALTQQNFMVTETLPVSSRADQLTLHHNDQLSPILILGKLTTGHIANEYWYFQSQFKTYTYVHRYV